MCVCRPGGGGGAGGRTFSWIMRKAREGNIGEGLW